MFSAYGHVCHLNSSDYSTLGNDNVQYFAWKVTSVNVVRSRKQSALKTVTGNKGMELDR